jgi:hypothetical protein
MPAVARKDGTDSVNTNHGCDPKTVTEEGSGDVFVNNIGIVRQRDKNKEHAFGGKKCRDRHKAELTVCSTTVFANNRGVGRIGDKYGIESIASGSPNVFAG